MSITPFPICLVVVDGLSPDAIALANTPTLQELISSGAATLRATTVFPSITLPCHLSLFLGVPPQDHGTLSNIYASHDWQGTSLAGHLHCAGQRTASFSNWEELRDLSRPGELDLSLCLNSAESDTLPPGESDRLLTRAALMLLADHSADFCFVYLGCLDSSGHHFGWMSTEYLNTLDIADECIGQLVAALPQHTFIVTADHGGHGHDHGTHQPKDMTIPFIANGPGIPKGEIKTEVKITDIAPTISALAGLTPPAEWVGRNIFS